MSNNKQSSIDWLIIEIMQHQKTFYGVASMPFWLVEQAKAMQQEQAQLYATFVLKCVQNNLPPITFNDWINLENNEQH